MKAQLKLDKNLRFIGINSEGLQTAFDTHPEFGGEDSAATPLEIVLQASAACSSLDIVSILRKKKKNVVDFNVDISAERKETHPRVFTSIHYKFILTSPDAELADLDKAIGLSQGTYCSVSAMLKASGCEVTWESQIIRPE